MAPFSIPAPCIIPLRLPVFGARRTIDTQTKIELVCETYIDHEVFYTLDGTRPQPYAGIVQGSKLFKYQAPFCLPPGKVTVKAMALNARICTMRSNVVTKCFEVLRSVSEPEVPKKAFKKKKKKVAPEIKVESDLRDALFGDDYREEDVVEPEFDGGDKKDLCVDEPCSSVEDFPVHSEALRCDGEDASDSSQSGRSIESVPEGEDPLNIAKCESEQETPVSSAPQSPAKEHIADKHVEDGFGDILKVESKACSCNIKSESPPCCIKCEASVQYCLTCSSVNASTSKFCIQCGQKLMQVCAHCNELNFVIATFCQFCGQKFQFSEDSNVSNVDRSSSAKPRRSNASVQKSFSLESKQTQTLTERKDRKMPQRLPSRSPGRGYWHQQLDYICNHLKSYAYNNNEFRDSISEPVLSEFQTAKVTKSEDSVSITLQFAPLTLDEKV